jgi:hypothetical protein
MKLRCFLWSFIALIVCATPALAEIMDKYPTPNYRWLLAIPGAILGWILHWRNYRLA